MFLLKHSRSGGKHSWYTVYEVKVIAASRTVFFFIANLAPQHLNWSRSSWKAISGLHKKHYEKQTSSLFHTDLPSLYNVTLKLHFVGMLSQHTKKLACALQKTFPAGFYRMAVCTVHIKGGCVCVTLTATSPWLHKPYTSPWPIKVNTITFANLIQSTVIIQSYFV